MTFLSLALFLSVSVSPSHSYAFSFFQHDALSLQESGDAGKHFLVVDVGDLSDFAHIFDRRPLKESFAELAVRKKAKSVASDPSGMTNGHSRNNALMKGPKGESCSTNANCLSNRCVERGYVIGQGGRRILVKTCA